MIQINFPEYPFRIKEENGRRYIFDLIRKKYVHLSPEEWVRQHLLVYLTETKAYPKGLIAVEKAIKVNGLTKRYDIVIFNRQQQPWMLIEVKEPTVGIATDTLEQLIRYHQVLQCSYWVLSNGRQHYCAAVRNHQVDWLRELPAFEQ